jgi:hypothetical protein
MTAARQLREMSSRPFREMTSLPFIEIELAAGSLGVLVRLGGLKMTADRAIESGTGKYPLTTSKGSGSIIPS